MSKKIMKTLRENASYLLLLAIMPMMLACEDPGVIAFEHNNKIKWSGLEEVPPGTVTDIKDVMDLGNWNLEFMSLSPNGGLLALGLRSDSSPAEGILDAKVMIYNIYRGVLLQEWDEEFFKQLIEANVSFTYPSELVDFNPRNLAWMNNNELLMNIQPIIAGTGVDDLSQDVALVIKYTDATLTQGPDFYPRTDPSPLTAPDHPQKTTFSSENQNGDILVAGSAINGLPGSIEKFEFVYLGN